MKKKLIFAIIFVSILLFISEIGEIDFKGYTFFQTYAGIDGEQINEGSSVKFIVYLDDQVAYESEVMTSNNTQQKIQVDLNDSEELKLVFIGQSEDKTYNQANWVKP